MESNEQKRRIIALIETAVGVRDLEKILTHKRISGVALGAIDLAVDLDITLTNSGLELLYTRSRMVMLAKATGINGIYDTVYADIHNSDSLRIRAASASQVYGSDGRASEATVRNS